MTNYHQFATELFCLVANYFFHNIHRFIFHPKGNYFRVQDISLKGKRCYLDSNNPTNKIVNGKQKGRNKEEYERLTHFKNKDGDD